LQFEAFTTEKVPATHPLQLAEPEEVEKEPAGQMEHDGDAGDE